MKWLLQFGAVLALSYLSIAVIGLALKVWYVLFMWGWNAL